MRIRVKDVLDLLAGGLLKDDILKDYPDLQTEDISVPAVRGSPNQPCSS